jgi:hypothetical protein
MKGAGLETRGRTAKATPAGCPEICWGARDG